MKPVRRWSALCVVGVMLLSLSLNAVAHPNHALDSLSRAAAQNYAAGQWQQAAVLYARSIRNGNHDPATAYNCACCWALALQPDSAFACLDTALARDFTNVQHLADDEDLNALHSDPRWTDLVERMRTAQWNYLRRNGLNSDIFFMLKSHLAARKLADDSSKRDSLAAAETNRRHRIHQLVADSQLVVSQDFYNAAVILYASDDTADSRLAYRLAAESASRDSTDDEARWLTACAQDHWLWTTGKPQIFGTQSQRDKNGQWTLEPLSSTAVSDDKRAHYGVPPMSDLRKMITERNAHTGR